MCDNPIAWAEAWCQWCGETLPIDRDPRRLYCSTQCKTDFHNDRRRQRLAAARAGKRCALCDLPFVAPKAHRIYCSRKCACKASDMRRAERKAVQG